MTPPGRARWKRRVRSVALVVLIVGGLPAAAHFYLRWSSDWELRKAAAEADRLDPGWRLQDLENSREAIAESENSALKVLAIKKMMPERPGRSEGLNNPHRSARRIVRDIDSEAGVLMPRIRTWSPEVQFSPEMIQLLRDDLSHMSSALVEARKLVDFPRGRYPIEYARRLWETVLISDESHIVAKLLWEDAILAAQDQQIDKALSSAVAMLNTGRSIGDEPMSTSHSQRLLIQNLALVTIERALAQGQASAKKLEAVQRFLEDEAAQPLLLQAFRAERAGTYEHMTAIFSGEWKYTLRFFHGRVANKLPLRWNRYIDTVIVRRTYPAYFRLLTALVEIAKLPYEDQLLQIERLVEQSRQFPKEFQSWFEATARASHGFLRNQAGMRCAVAAMAVERFRLARGRWPDSLTGLVPEFLPRALVDPFDGQPLRFLRLIDSLLIYSIGPDGKDDGGLVNRGHFQPAGSDVGFQLWDVSRRRQPPPAQAKPVTEADEDQAP